MIRPPLIELLGAVWSLGARVNAVAWLRNGARVAYGLEDGTAALARAAWEGAPTLRPRPEGGAELAPGRGPPPPVIRAAVHGGACVALAPDEDGFLAGGADGGLARIAADGTAEPLAAFPGEPVTAVAAARGGWACAGGARACKGTDTGPPAGVLDLPGAAAALAADPRGGGLAVAHEGGVTLWPEDGAPRLLARPGRSTALAWSPDGRHLANGARLWRLPEGDGVALEGHPGEATALAFAGDGGFLAAAGAPGVLVWRLGPPSGPEVCGVPSERHPVVAVACHPRRALIAAGHGNGAVLLGPPGGRDALFVRAAGGGAVTALAFAPDGTRLAFGTEGGEAGLVALPDLLFRPDGGAPDDNKRQEANR